MLNDPFSTTYEGSRQGLGTLGQAIQLLGQQYAEKKKKEQNFNLLRQLGIITEEEPNLKDYEKLAKQKGASLNVAGDMTEEEKLSTAEKLIGAFGLQKPKTGRMKINLENAKNLPAGFGVNFTTGETEYKVPSKTTYDIANPEGLTSEQQLQARALAKKIYGVRGAQLGLPAVYEEMRRGKTIDTIEDDLRYAGQSKEFSGAVRNASQSILINTPQDKAQNTMDYIDDLLSKGDTEGVKNQLKRASMVQAGMEEQRAVVGKERTIKLLDEIQGDLNNLEKMGVNTNIFTGTAEEVSKRAGTMVNPEARKIATKITTAIQNYRRAMTGVQFGMPENKEYKDMFPSISRTANFNNKTIQALREVMTGDLDNFYSLSMGEENYKKLFKEGQTQPTQSQTKENSWTPEKENRYQELLKKQGR